ncbi:MAG: membrane-bound metallopeptidase [Parcubacteria group bacterium Gr01-1014_91]|nr:MAG: membrane-bound metallopeptidase [Parcubacteria group bacterium Gr01-1014_91]
MSRPRVVIFLFLSVVFFSFIPVVHAQSVADLQAQIDANNRQLESLKADIAAFQKQLDVLGAKKDTLQSTINSLALSQKQLATQIQITQNKIASANLQIRQLTFSIGDKEASIVADQDAISKALRIIAEGEQTPLIATLISARSLGDAWRAADEMLQFNRALEGDINALRKVRSELASNRDRVTVVKANLVALQNDLAVQKKSVEVSKAAQQKLLADTKNQEGIYQKLVAQKRAQQTEFENQLFQYEAQLRQALDSSSIPTARVGILSPPLGKIFVTQYFGKTVDSKRLYLSGTHGGVDFKAGIGTPVKAALTGIVVDTESIKIKNGCQYGKWVLIKHANGLSTIYGHLSYVYVSPGDIVTTGQVIGLSGDTGYAEGPHLHFGVYATAGIKIVDSGALGSIRCAGIKTVAANPTAYLNPLSYL